MGWGEREEDPARAESKEYGACWGDKGEKRGEEAGGGDGGYIRALSGLSGAKTARTACQGAGNFLMAIYYPDLIVCHRLPPRDFR